MEAFPNTEGKESPAPTDIPNAGPEASETGSDAEKESPVSADVLTGVLESSDVKTTAETSVLTGATRVMFETGTEKPLPKNVPMATPEAIEFMSSVGEEELGLCLFAESLYTVSDLGEELGSFTVSVQPAYYELEGYEHEKCFLVHASSQGSVDGVPCGTSIVGYVSQKLETLEQHHHEYIKVRGHCVDKKTHMRRQGDRLVITRVITEGEKVRNESTSHPSSLLSGWVSEASSLLIMRILARRKISERLVFLAFDAEMNLCASSYSELGSRTQLIGRDTAEVYGIEHTVDSDDIPVAWHCHFLTDGHLTSRVQIGSPVYFTLTKMPILSEAEESDPKPVFEKKPLIWQEDMQLLSEFQDRKEELVADHNTYLRRHPEIKILLADFMQFLLLRKPDDIITFAAEFFGPFSTNQRRGDSFLSSRISNPFRNEK